MRKNKTSKQIIRWGADERREFADGKRLRAQTIQGKRFDGATADEWADEADLWAEDAPAEECLCWDGCGACGLNNNGEGF
jgi:hypothetical protein